MSVEVSLTVNDASHELAVAPTENLVGVLRDRLGLTGTHRDCAMGVCGACTVLLDGQPVSACLLLAVQANGAAITTIEALEGDGELSPLQSAFLTHGAVQCGFCTPGFLMTATALLAENPRPTRAEIVDAIKGNLCRCTGYQKIVDAIESVAAG
jgi:carbon-monoxide dehydrogenase small subunit